MHVQSTCPTIPTTCTCSLASVLWCCSCIVVVAAVVVVVVVVCKRARAVKAEFRAYLYSNCLAIH